MYLLNLFLLLLCVITSHQSQDLREDKFNIWPNAVQAPHRILELMRSYYEEGNVRIAAMNEMRFMYEESPYYEQGYIIGEIIERFRKLVEHAQHPIKFASDTVPDTLVRLELVQKLHFELYHLVRMMHETPRKWRYMPEFRLAPGKDADQEMGLAELYAAQKNVIAMQQQREKERKRKKKMYDKLRQAYLKGLSDHYSGHKEIKFPKRWPLDYGWEIDIDW